MKKDLEANIRAFRKEKCLTQEQLAAVFGVTVGAVHKWEAGLPTPDLALIFEMADFFDTSLDVLAGYEARDNRVEVLASVCVRWLIRWTRPVSKKPRRL